jgi:hypothetical protein
MNEKSASYVQRRTLPLSATDLRALGKGQVGYVRCYGQPASPTYVLHAADGTALAVQKDEESAQMSAAHHELNVVLVH